MITSSNIFLVGPMGAGKSTVGKQLATTLGRTFYDTDQEIESRTGVDIAWIFSVEGEDGFRKRENQMVEELTALNNVVLSTGGGTVVDPANREALSRNGTVIYLQTSQQEQLSRTERNRRNRPMLQVDDIEGRIENLMDERAKFYQAIADFAIGTDNKSVKTVVNEIIKALDNQF